VLTLANVSGQASFPTSTLPEGNTRTRWWGTGTGDAIDTVGVRANPVVSPGDGVWLLRNTNSAGPFDLSISFGSPNGIPLTWRRLPVVGALGPIGPAGPI